ncbi:hypothetical protein [Limnovirga soli]|jgi:hypothetical protein|uniref:Uncharacterized protein n=1 Tax=Limnovirga soli TaxID=2656915 RepID=A0A8J8JWA9_9BACT|nr:hypothetical protein [Limnovirga soli]NNV55101.1 hypothetical protein [Limnovirga soli]
MTIDQFKTLNHPEKLKEIKYNGILLGSFERNNEPGGKKQPGDLFELHDFWVFLSEDEQTVIPTRRNIYIPEKSE